jgi:NADPH2:quinone reductase
MRAIVVREFGPFENLKVEDISPPAPPKAGKVLLDVHAAGVNFPDLLVIAGKYQILPPRPFVPGKEAAGIVAAVGAGVTTCKPGDRVMAWVEHGAFAGQALAPERSCYLIPDGMSFEQAAAFTLTFQTAHFALVARAQFKSGETVLVTGASGGVGLAAVQLAKALGANVLAAVSSAEKGAVAKANGADHIVDTSAANLRDALREQVRAVTGGRGADIVLEQVGGDVFDASLRALAWQGRLVVIGFAGGRIPEVKANYLLVRNIAVLGLQISDYRDAHPEWMRRVQSELLALVAGGKLKPHVMAAYPLEQFAQALGLIRDRKVQGKAVVTLR